MIRLRAGLLIATALVLLSGTACAVDESAYQVNYDRARELVRAGDLPAAITAFEAAYAASPKPEPLFNIAILYRRIAIVGAKADDARRSINAFQAYLELHRTMRGADPDDAKTVERYIAELRETFGIKESEPAPIPSPAASPSSERPVEIVSMRSTPSYDRPPTPSLRHRRRIATWVVGGTGLALLAGSLASGLVANSKYKRLEDGCGGTGICNGATFPEAASLIDSGRAAGLASDVLLGIGLAAFATGVVLFFVEGRHPGVRRGSRGGPRLAAGGSGLVFEVGP